MAADIPGDDKALREGRRRRALAEMEAHDIDVLLLGREANARYVSGAQRLWTAGTRPFGPGCVVVRATGAVHLVSTWDEGVPDDIPHENLFGITWNPGNLLAWLKSIEGVMEASCIGTDSSTPRFAMLLPKVFPSAKFVDAEPALEAARRVKTPEELTSIIRSIDVAEKALAAAVAELRPGVSSRHLAAVFMEAMARQGVTTPATQRVAWPSGQGLMAFDAGVVAGGYSAEVGRTWPTGSVDDGGRARGLYRRADDLWSRLLAACRPGASGSELLGAYEARGFTLPSFPIVTGLGLGFDLPVVTGDLRKTAEQERLAPGMVLAVTAHIEDGGQAVFRKESVLVTADGPEVLTSSPHWHP